MKICATLVTAFCAASAGADIAVSDFQDGTTQGWTQGFGGTAAVANAGPSGAGDFALEAVPNPGSARLFPHTTTTPGFIGDLAGSGVLAIQFDAMAPTSNTDTIELYGVVLNTSINRWASLDSATINADGFWGTYTLSLAEADMIQVLGGADYATVFGNVTQIGLRHQDSAAQSGGSSLADANQQLFLDNIKLVPAPGAAAVLGAGCLLASRRRR